MMHERTTGDNPKNFLRACDNFVLRALDVLTYCLPHIHIYTGADMQKAKTTLLVRLDPKLHKALKRHASDRDETQTEVVERALKREIENPAAA